MPLFIPLSGIGDFLFKFDYLVGCLYAPFEDTLLPSIFFDICFLFGRREAWKNGIGSFSGGSFLALFGYHLIKFLLG
jgi:hypothetical protein